MAALCSVFYVSVTTTTLTSQEAPVVLYTLKTVHIVEILFKIIVHTYFKSGSTRALFV